MYTLFTKQFWKCHKKLNSSFLLSSFPFNSVETKEAQSSAVLYLLNSIPFATFLVCRIAKTFLFVISVLFLINMHVFKKICDILLISFCACGKKPKSRSNSSLQVFSYWLEYVHTFRCKITNSIDLFAARTFHTDTHTNTHSHRNTHSHTH